jgi:hypothetical protein
MAFLKYLHRFINQGMPRQLSSSLHKPAISLLYAAF